MEAQKEVRKGQSQQKQGKPAIRQSGNPAIRQSGNPGIVHEVDAPTRNAERGP